MTTTGIRSKLTEMPGEYQAVPDDPDVDPGVDEDLLIPMVGQAIEAFQKAVGDFAREFGATFEDFSTAMRILTESAEIEPVIVQQLLEVIARPAFPGEADVVATVGTPEDTEGPVYYEGAPFIDNPGSLPMRPDEKGTPPIISGQVRSTDGRPLSGAELDIWLATVDGHYSNTGLDDQPEFNLRGRQLADKDGRFEFRAIKPVPYYIPINPPGVVRLLRALGFAKYRARHVHVKIRHPELPAEYTSQLYFAGDPYLNHDAVTVTRAETQDLLLAPTRHDNPDEIAARALDQAFEAAEFDFVLAATHEVTAVAS